MTPRRRGTAKSRNRRNVDPLEQAIEVALDPDSFISYEATWSFVDNLQEVATTIGELVEKEPGRAARLFETFIAACHLKADEIDDSSGNFGLLVGALFQGWIRARQAGGADPEETAQMLGAWMDDDPYGFCYHLEREASEVLDRKGLRALVAQIRSRYEAAQAASDQGEATPAYAQRRWGDALKTVLASAGDIEAFTALCEQTELRDEDCKTVAEIYRRRRRPEDALSWVERGLEISESGGGFSSAEHELRYLQRKLLSKLGRAEDALASAWADFEEHPGKYAYKELLRFVPTREKKAWHEKAMDAAESAGLWSQIELWLELREMERLEARIRKATDEELEDLGHYCAESLAGRLKRPHPDLAARVYRALGMRIVNAGKSKYYDAALDHLESAKECYTKAGLDGEWEMLVAEVRVKHHRKTSFMPSFDDIVSGASKEEEPSFLERAKMRWPAKAEEE